MAAHEWERLRHRAEEHLMAAQELDPNSAPNVVYELARTAAELAGKSLLASRGIPFPRRHTIQGLLYQHGLIPATVHARRLSVLLGDYSRGAYDLEGPVSAEEASDAVALASAMVEAARS